MKKTFIYIIGIIIVIAIVLGILFKLKFINIENIKIEITLKEDLTASFLEERHVSDYITSINGQIIDDYIIDTKEIGIKDVSFSFINDEGKKANYTYQIEVIDKVKPIVWLSGSYTITKGSDINLTEKILCGDNEDNNPECLVIGEYDKNKTGVYPLVFKATDRSGNITEEKFNLNVIEPRKNTPSNNNPTYTYFKDVVKNYKNDKTKIGIDVSSWQGEIDFNALKNAGVEFIIIRVGGTRGMDDEYFVDKYFENNISKANELGIDVGIYFYSYSNSSEKAKEEANWVLDKIKDYKVTLPIAYDWENWSTFNNYNLSFFSLTSMADTFLDTIKDAGYEGLRYSSKSYLEKLWLPSKYETWLAHYVDKTTYTGKYRYWQLCDDGKVDGINGPVDIDIMYLD